MSKAFDRVDYKKLITKLRNYGFGGNLLKWFQSYLSDRCQRVTVIGCTSNTLLVGLSSGVPQGSILGQALFLLYVNDLCDSVKFSEVAMFVRHKVIFICQMSE
jgi:hypothetical protein